MFNLSHIRGEGFCFIGWKGKARWTVEYKIWMTALMVVRTNIKT